MCIDVANQGYSLVAELMVALDRIIDFSCLEIRNQAASSRPYSCHITRHISLFCERNFQNRNIKREKRRKSNYDQLCSLTLSMPGFQKLAQARGAEPPPS